MSSKITLKTYSEITSKTYNEITEELIVKLLNVRTSSVSLCLAPLDLTNNIMIVKDNSEE